MIGSLRRRRRRYLVEQFEAGGGQGPRYGGAKVSWAQTEDQARKNAYEWWPNMGLKGGGQELSTPHHFEQAVKNVSEEDVSKTVVTGNDPQQYLECIQKYVDAGFDHVYLNQTGPNQEAFIGFAERGFFPRSSNYPANADRC